MTQIFVRTVSGHLIEVDVDLVNGTLDDVKLQIYKKEGIPPEQQKLIINGHRRYCELLSMLSDFGTEHPPTICLVLLSVRCGPTSPHTMLKYIFAESFPVSVLHSIIYNFNLANSNNYDWSMQLTNYIWDYNPFINNNRNYIQPLSKCFPKDNELVYDRSNYCYECRQWQYGKNVTINTGKLAQNLAQYSKYVATDDAVEYSADPSGKFSSTCAYYGLYILLGFDKYIVDYNTEMRFEYDFSELTNDNITDYIEIRDCLQGRAIAFTIYDIPTNQSIILKINSASLNTKYINELFDQNDINKFNSAELQVNIVIKEKQLPTTYSLLQYKGHHIKVLNLKHSVFRIFV